MNHAAGLAAMVGVMLLCSMPFAILATVLHYIL